MDDWEQDDPTIFDVVPGAIPSEDLHEATTREHQTEPGMLAATAPSAAEPSADEQWLAAVTTTLQAVAHDVRRAIIAEGRARKATPGWCAAFAEAVLRRAKLIR